jgi:abequosyltransferase
MKLSVCIPAYNRQSVLPELLDSIYSQDYDSFEIVICEDYSPQREQIRDIVRAYQSRFPGSMVYVENKENLGYDRNLRALLENATGEFVVFMGNDDLLSEGALRHIANTISNYDNVGMYLRSYAAFEEHPQKIVQTYKYFERELYFPPGRDSIITLFRRSVVISGLTFHRESALRCASSKFDGTLLYQLYMLAEILMTRGAVYSPEVVALYRNGGVPDFGNSAIEKSGFKPGERTPESSLHFVEGMLEIAWRAANVHNIEVYKPILRDLANYSYPLLSVQANKSYGTFFAYCWNLGKLGFRRYPIFWAYFLILSLIGSRNSDALINKIKTSLGRTPLIGKVYQGDLS